MSRQQWRCGLAAALCLGLGPGLASAAGAAEKPVSLEEILAFAEQAHPDLDLATAQKQLAEAEQALVESLDALRVSIEGRVQQGRNRFTGNEFESDNNLRLNFRKTLFDSGRQTALLEAAKLEVEARSLQQQCAVSQRRMALMSRFFDVLLADLQFAADNEFMAVAFVNWDNSRERQELGQISAVRLAELEMRFQEWRSRRNEAERRSREKRLQLAATMNQPDRVISELVEPKFPDNDRALPEFERLFSLLQGANPRLRWQRQLIAAAQQRLEAVRADYRPVIEFEAEAATWSREAPTRNEAYAGLNLSWPIYQGRRTDARLAREQAQIHILQAEYEQQLLDLRQLLYRTWEEIQHLRGTERRAAQINAIYRDLDLEKARAEYELELKTNLGDGMAETQAAIARTRAVEYRIALAWARLDVLLCGHLNALIGEKTQ